MASVRLNGDTSGFIEISAPSVAGSTTITLPATSGGNFLVTDSNGDLNVDSGTLFVDASENRVGIGTTSPDKILTLREDNAGGEGASIRLHNSSATVGSNNKLIFTSSTTATVQSAAIIATRTASGTTIAFESDGTNERLRIDESGRLLVGTSSSTAVASGSAASVQVATDVSSIHQSWADYSTSGSNSPRVVFGKSVSGTKGSAGSALENNNELGNIRFAGSNGTTLNTQAVAITVKCDADWNSNSNPGRIEIATTPNNSTVATERMRLNSAGGLKVRANGAANVSSNTSASHELTTDINGFEALLVTNRNSTSPLGIQVFYPTDINNTANAFISCFGSSTRRAEIRSNGGIANFQSNDANLCDEREKKNIESLDSTWGCLKNWEVKKFHYNEDADTDDKRYGVIAQQVAPHCPEVITDWVKQKAQDAVLDEDGNVVTPAVEEIVRMGVKEQQMYWMAIRALQEAQTRIETLETANASLEARLTALEGGN